MINSNLLFNMYQQEYYLVTDELKCHNVCLKYPLFSLSLVRIRMSHSRHSVAVPLSHISGDQLNLVYERKVI